MFPAGTFQGFYKRAHKIPLSLANPSKQQPRVLFPPVKGTHIHVTHAVGSDDQVPKMVPCPLLLLNYTASVPSNGLGPSFPPPLERKMGGWVGKYATYLSSF